MLLENPSTYVEFAQSEMSEIEFLTEIARRTGCGLLLDVNNVYVGATNHDYDPAAYIDAFPVEHVGEIHLGGHARQEDDAGAPLLIDDHARETDDAVWALYRRLIARAGRRPTLVEWDNDIPAWPTLFAEAQAAEEPSCGSAAAMPRFTEMQGAFAGAVRRADRDLPEGVTSHSAEAPTRRFNVYRNNFYASLIDVLAGRYPVVQRLVGEEFFRAMVKVYVEQEPPRSAMILAYGGGFADFLEPVSAGR